MRNLSDQATAVTTVAVSALAKSVETDNDTSAIRPLCQFVYILEPRNVSLESQKEEVKLSNEYNKSNQTQDLARILRQVGYGNVEICSVDLDNYRQLIERFVNDANGKTEDLVVFNLCDGCESDGYPGVSIINELEARNLAYTGSTPAFYNITTSKPELKRYLNRNGVPTSKFVEITPQTTAAELDSLGSYPLIVKPSISYASISITDKSVVHNAQEALAQARCVKGVDNGIFVEKFLAGREFTAFVTGSKKEGIQVYQVAERVFNPNLGKYQRILAFDRYWDGYGADGTKPEKPQTVYWYAFAPEDIQEKLKIVAGNAYLAVEGSGYGRVDMRTDSLESSDPIVLEVNANCGISFNFTDASSTVGEILRMSNVTPVQFASDLIRFALERKKSSAQL